MKRFLIIAAAAILLFSINVHAHRRWTRTPYYGYPAGWYGYYYNGYSINGYAWPPPARITYKAYFQRNREDLNEIYSLEARKAAADAFIRELRLITVSESYIVSYASGAYAEITVNNNSRFEIKKFYFSGAVTSSTDKQMTGDSFEYEPGNSLMPLNAARYKIALDHFKQWCTDLCVFSVRVSGIETADGQILRENAFSSEDERRLGELRQQFR